MPFNTLTVSAAVTPSIIETCLSHYLHRAPLRHKPTAHISYHEGLRLIREFLEYSSRHRVEDLQAFTSQHVPSPAWIRTSDVEVAPQFLVRAAEVLRTHLGARGCAAVGGREWWVWRRPDAPLRAEWIEMKKEFLARKRTGARCERVMLYVHGGAYYFGSVDEHRYQMQRHARKLRARVLSPRYRLAPQFPFPCGLLDCLATYFYLLEHFAPSEILVAGDSAGAGMVLSLLVVLRDQGWDLPAGTILLSPWVDLTHSFPSVAGDGAGDYIPAHGFHHKPSMAWPPPPSSEGVETGLRGHGNGNANGSVPEDAVELPTKASPYMSQHAEGKDAAQRPDEQRNQSIPRFGAALSLTLDGKLHTLNQQIHLYTTNPLLPHPLVSPILQPSLGGLPPMLIQTGGAELLRDEQLYLAHKAANPSAYPPNESIMREFDPSRKSLERWPPTDVQIQLWEDLCHVPQTLSFTRPAKYMYRGIAQFGAWALARAKVAQSAGSDGVVAEDVMVEEDDVGSFISSGGEGADSDAEVESKAEEKSIAESSSATNTAPAAGGDSSPTSKLSSRFLPLKKKKSLPILSKPVPPPHASAVGKAGDPIPPFTNHMIRQRVTRHGIIHPLAPAADLACLALDPATIGVPKAGPVRKWLRAREAWDVKFAAEAKKVEKRREAVRQGMGDFVTKGEKPPPTALVGRWRKGDVGEDGAEKKKRGKSWGLAMWSGWGSSHDEHTLQRTEKMAGRRDSGGAEGVGKKRGASVNTFLGGAGREGGGEEAVGKQSMAAASTSSRMRGQEAATMPSSRRGLESSGGDGVRNTSIEQEGPATVAVVDASQNEERGLPNIVSADTTTTSPSIPATAVTATAAATAAATAVTTASAVQTEHIQRPMSTSISSPIPVENATTPRATHPINETPRQATAPVLRTENLQQRPMSASNYSPIPIENTPPPTATTDQNNVSEPHPQFSAVPSALRTADLPAVQRPMSASISSPIPVENEARHRRQVSLNAREAPITVDAVGNGESARDAQTVVEEREAPTVGNESNLQASNPPHIELMGDSPAPVELPSTNERSPPQTNDNDVFTLDTPGIGTTVDDLLVSPIDPPTQQQQQNDLWAARMRNQGFNQRTSMLGSIGADGMPNAHHTFVRDDVAPRRAAPAVPSSIESDENARRESWEGVDEDENVNPVGSAAESLQVPLGEGKGSAQNRESGVLGLQLGGLNLVGDQRDQENGSPAPESDAPAPVRARPPIPNAPPPGLDDDDDDANTPPPPPPPKDEKHIPSPVKPKGKITGLRKPIQRLNSVESLPGSSAGLSASAGNKVASSLGNASASASTAPVIGDLFFERPVLDTSVPAANEGRDANGI